MWLVVRDADKGWGDLTQGYVALMGLAGIFAWQRLWQRGRPISAPCVLGSCVSYQHMHGWSSSDGCRPGFAVRQLFWRVCMFPAMGAGAAVLLGGFLGGGCGHAGTWVGMVGDR